MRRVAANAALLIVALFFAFVFGEVGLRLAGIGYGYAPIEASRRLHHEHPKDYRFLAWDPSGEFGGHEVVYDDAGYRIDEDAKQPAKAYPPGGRRIAFLGDSFAEANTVTWAESYIGLLERANPGTAVRDYGVSSYAPMQYLIQIKQDVPAFKPTDVVLQLYSNDFGDDYLYLKAANSRDLEAVTSIDGGDRDLAITLLRYSYLARLIRRSQLTAAHLLKFGNNAQPEFVPDSSLPPRWLEWTQNGVAGTDDLTWDLLKIIRRETEKMGAHFYLFIIPDKIATKRNKCCGDDKLSALTAEFARSQGISYIDLAQAFGQQPDQTRLFWKNDIHLTPMGNLLAARTISDKMGLTPPAGGK